jgi:SAM-dependent methyltransferase
MPEIVLGPNTRFNAPEGAKLVLNAGCGFYAPSRLHPVFRNAGTWSEVRLDIDASVKPDIVASITDLSPIGSATIDAIWCSHNLEHLHSHDVTAALAEFRRVLKPDGFALITSPDLEEIAQLIIEGRLEDEAYRSPAGPITALDMLYGHSASIQAGHHHMAHNTGFTAETLGKKLAKSQFTEVFVSKGKGYDIWALALMPDANKAALANQFVNSEIDFFSAEVIED